jgi:leucyl/phenylalanyl-tRNA---protein transferase
MRQDVTPEMLLRAYAMGVFPMAEGRHAEGLGWYDPDMRGILPLENFHVPKRLARTVLQRVYDVTINQDFAGVIRACADARRDTWINDQIIDLYVETHRLGYAHSIETRDKQGQLVGGVYGLSMGGAFFGESMFSTARDASKVALVHLAAQCWKQGVTLLDAQFVNPHLLQFGCVEIPRAAYHEKLQAALALPVSFAGDGYSSAGVSAAGAASGCAAGSLSAEKSCGFAAVADFLQSITQTS